MEILDNKIVKRDGNECLLTDAIALIRINYDLYIVTHTSAVDCGLKDRSTKNPDTIYMGWDECHTQSIILE